MIERRLSIGQQTADIILILTDINMICVTDMSRKYCKLFKLDIKNNKTRQQVCNQVIHIITNPHMVVNKYHEPVTLII